MLLILINIKKNILKTILLKNKKKIVSKRIFIMKNILLLCVFCSLLSQNYITRIPQKGAGLGHQFIEIIYTMMIANHYKLKYVDYGFNYLSIYKGKDLEKLFDINYEFEKYENIKNKTKIINDKRPLNDILKNIDNKKDNLIIVDQNNISHLELPHLSKIFNQNINIINKLKLIYQKNSENYECSLDPKKINIAAHIRRRHSNIQKIRYTKIETFNSILNQIIDLINTKEYHVHIYSNGNIEEFNDLKINNVTFHLDEDDAEQFISMSKADILVTCKSGFSIIAGYFSDNIIFYTPHWSPKLKNWINYDNETGKFDEKDLLKQLKNKKREIK